MVAQAFSRGFAALKHPEPLVRVSAVLLALDVANVWMRPPAGPTALAGLAGLKLLLPGIFLAFVQYLVMLGLTNVAIGAVRDEAGAEGRAWDAITKLPQFVVIGVFGFIAIVIASIPLGALVVLAGRIGIGIACVIGVGVLYAILTLSQYSFLILDGRAEWLDSLTESAALTKGHRAAVLLLFIVGLTPVMVVGSLARILSRLHVLSPVPSQPVAIVLALVSTVVSIVWILVAAAFYDELLAERDRAQSMELSPVLQ
jgi:hypothetical protein